MAEAVIDLLQAVEVCEDEDGLFVAALGVL